MCVYESMFMCVCVHKCMRNSVCAWGGECAIVYVWQRTMYRNEFSPSTILGPGDRTQFNRFGD